MNDAFYHRPTLSRNQWVAIREGGIHVVKEKGTHIHISREGILLLITQGSGGCVQFHTLLTTGIARQSY